MIVSQFQLLSPILTARDTYGCKVAMSDLKAQGRQFGPLDHRAISGPLTAVRIGLSRSLTDSPPRRSSPVEGRIAQIPKLIVQIRGSSPSRIDICGIITAVHRGLQASPQFTGRDRPELWRSVTLCPVVDACKIKKWRDSARVGYAQRREVLAVFDRLRLNGYLKRRS